ncbi:uncharacterized protein SAPINGB_P002384 [Magnusiomyces paraingens]|uniref:Glycosyl transferase family 25 domain-containing protein n=1 Tax=Magnusiomyces paraingens TaxID=2606893 RepID=A0A5E8BDX1_9ASCO|nr:uncharacterized protein SAPINGB_P002384 [Saprochaete ingens]VVT49669.1 unnamed protein product [Saprochaete ingens]
MITPVKFMVNRRVWFILVVLILLAAAAFIFPQHSATIYGKVGTVSNKIVGPSAKELKQQAKAVQEAQIQYSKPGSDPTNDIVLEDEPNIELPQGLANETLGLQKIFYININTRFDRENTFHLQSSLSGIRADRIEGFKAAEIAKLREQGMNLPSSKKSPDSIIGCYMAHNKVWQKVLDENLSTALIMEADAAWDVNIRAIMYHLSHGLEHMLRQQNLLMSNEHSTKQDPYLSSHWDVLQLGACWREPPRSNLAVQYYDPHVNSGFHYYGKPLTLNRRVIRYREANACTVAYAVSQAGARKLALRAGVDMDMPVDIVIKRLVALGLLRTYSVFPVLFDQWEYKYSLGVHNTDSDIRKLKEIAGSNEEGNATPERQAELAADIEIAEDPEKQKLAWERFHKNMDIWQYRFPQDTNFTHGMLEEFRDLVFDRAALDNQT